MVSLFLFLHARELFKGLFMLRKQKMKELGNNIKKNRFVINDNYI